MNVHDNSSFQRFRQKLYRFIPKIQTETIQVELKKGLSAEKEKPLIFKMKNDIVTKSKFQPRNGSNTPFLV